MVLRWLAAEGCADCFQDWRLYRVDVHPEVVVEETFSLKRCSPRPVAVGAFSAAPAARIGSRYGPPGPRDGECLLECFADETASAIARRACEKLPLFCSDRYKQGLGQVPLSLRRQDYRGLGDVDQDATLFLAPPPPTTHKSRQE